MASRFGVSSAKVMIMKAILRTEVPAPWAIDSHPIGAERANAPHGCSWTLLGFILLFSLVLASNPLFAAERYDLILKNGRIVDGAGTPWYVADLAVRDRKIAAIGRLRDADAAQTIDALGLVVAPGFIDMMGQTGSPFLKDPAAALNLLMQGITTINAGEGDSAAPLAGAEARQ